MNEEEKKMTWKCNNCGNITHEERSKSTRGDGSAMPSSGWRCQKCLKGTKALCDEQEMKFEIINPSDEAYIEGSFKDCCIATLIFGKGKYALKEINGELEMPLFLFSSADTWLKERFGKTFEELLNEMNVEDVKKALLSVHLVRERTSLNDFTSRAHIIANSLKKVRK